MNWDEINMLWDTLYYVLIALVIWSMLGLFWDD